MDNYQLLIRKLDEFIRKYYKNQLLRGVIYSLSAFLISFLFISIVEYFAHFNTALRTSLFYVFVGLNVFILAFWVGLPLLRLFRLGNIISHDQAAQVIGKHFPNVSDKLLNTLQLKRMAEEQATANQKQLIEASINQRIGDLKPVPFTQAINLGENKKYLKYAVVPLVVLIIISFASPHIVFDSTERLIKHRTYYEEQAPFEFNLQNDTLRAVRQENFTVNLDIEGDELPKEVYLHVNDNRYRMDKEEADKHRYTVRNLQEDFKLQFEANGFYSKPHEVKVLPKPLLQEYTVKLDYPDYTGKKDQTKQNVGDLDIPEGTRVSWEFQTQNTNSIKMLFKDTSINPKRTAENKFRVKRPFYQNQRYSLQPINDYMESPDSTVHYIAVVPDAYPQIKVQKVSDSFSEKRQFFSGEASDDYGLRKLAFHYEYAQSQDSTKVNQGKQTEYLSINTGQSITSFRHSWDLNKLAIQPGDEIRYYFEVWDNDGVNGSKSSRSQTFTFKAPTEEDLQEDLEESQEAIEEKLKEVAKETQKLNEKFKKAREKLLNKDDLNWEDKQFIKDAIEKQKSLQKQKEKLQQKYKKSLRKQDEYNQLDQSMKEKYERMNEIMNKSLSEEMKEQMEKLEKMLDNNQKKSIEKKLDKLNKQNRSKRKQLERSLELYKQLALEQKLKSTSKQLENLSDKQKELSEKTKKQENLSGKQDDQESGKKDDQEGKSEDEDQDEKKGNQEDADKKGDEKDASDKQKEGDQDEEKGDKKQKKDGDQSKPDNPIEKQESINKDFESIDKDLEKMQELNEEMDNQGDLSEQKKKSEELQKLLKKALEKMRQQKNDDAAKKQQDASQKMKEMSKQMKKMMSQMNQKSMKLNYQRVRKILENLIYLSTEQESLMEQFKEVEGYNPQFVKLAREQTNLKEDAQMIEDSLQALSEKVMMMKSKVNKEVEEINYQMKKTRGYLSDRKIGKVRTSQQYIMTATNNLALMLSKLMDQMQQQMSSSMSGSQMCNNPKPGKSGKKSKGKKGKKGKMGQIKKMQEKLGEKLGDLKKGKQGSRQGASSKDLARLAKMQEKIRQQLRELKQQQKESGGEEFKEQVEELEKMMKENEKDIINNDVSGETMQRQQQINVKMLEAKEAERKQGRDEKRKSKTADQLFRENPPSLEEYKEKRKEQVELLQTVPPTLNGYYRMKVQEYFKAIQ